MVGSKHEWSDHVVVVVSNFEDAWFLTVVNKDELFSEELIEEFGFRTMYFVVDHGKGYIASRADYQIKQG